MSPDGPERVWRRSNERYAQCCFEERTPYENGGFMDWENVSLEARTVLFIMDGGGITAHRYITDCLVDHIVLCKPFVVPNFIFMHVNARSYAANVVRDYLAAVDIRRMNYPPHNLDLNPIEHVWNKIGKRIRKHENLSETFHEPQRAVREE